MQTWLMDKMDMEVQRKNIHSENTPLHQAIYAGEVEKALALIPETAECRRCTRRPKTVF